MASVRCTDVPARPTECLEVPSVTLDALQQLGPPCAAAFQAPRAAWRLDGPPRPTRRCTVSTHWPLPTPDDRRFFLRTSLKTYALQVVQGRLCGMGQRQAHQWIHVLGPALLTALRARGDAPARSLTALAQRLGGSGADAATGVTPLAEEAPTPGGAVPTAAPASRLVPMPAPSGASSAPQTLRHRRPVRAARTRPTRAKMSCASMRCSSSAAAATPSAVAPMRSPLPPRRPLPGPRGVAWGRIWASWPVRCPTWTSSCRPRSHEDRR
jgi:hypothetical protein